MTDGEKFVVTAIAMTGGLLGLAVFADNWKHWRRSRYRRVVANAWLVEKRAYSEERRRYKDYGAKVRYAFAAGNRTHTGTTTVHGLPWGRRFGKTLSFEDMWELLSSEEGYVVGLFYDPHNPEKHFFEPLDSESES